MKTLSPEEIQLEIAKNNAIFAKATKAQKRVIVAKDVLSQIKNNSFTPAASSWGYVGHPEGPWNTRNRSFQNEAYSGKVECIGCALSSLFLSTCKINNHCNMWETRGFLDSLGCNVNTKKEFPSKFNEVFDRKQLKLIEIAFERGQGYFRQNEGQH
jgi:hypothetical protein